MAVVAVAIVLSFHLKHQPSQIELQMARPLGAIFWVLSVCCLLLGIGNYISECHIEASLSRMDNLLSQPTVATVNKYSRKAAIVQTGWITQLVCKRASQATFTPLKRRYRFLG
jgi:hypothetical protein